MTLIVRRLLILFAVPLMERVVMKAFRKFKNRKKDPTSREVIEGELVDG